MKSAAVTRRSGRSTGRRLLLAGLVSLLPCLHAAKADEIRADDAQAPQQAETRTRPLVESKLNPIFDRETLSGLLDRETDALRAGDPSTDYFGFESIPTPLIPQVRPLHRWLSDRGFTYEVIYKGEGMANVGGGLSKGMDYVHDARVTMLFDLGRLTGADWLKGWFVHGVVMNREGRQVGWDHVGERNVLLTELWSIHGPAAARLADLYAEKSFFGDRLNISLGRIALTHTYSTSALLCSFMLMCSAPMAIRVPAGWSVYPKTSWGATLRFRLFRDITVRTGLYRIGPKAQDNTGWAWGSEQGTGVQTPLEVTWEPFFGKDKLVGHYKFGFGHDSSQYPDLIGTIPAADLATVHVRHERAADTFYVEADQMVYRKGGMNQMSGGYLMAGYIHNTSVNSTITDEAYAGASLIGLIPGRPRDRLGLMYSYYRLSPRIAYGERLRQAAGMSLGENVYGIQTHSAVLEAYYSMPVVPGLVLSPEFEYMMRPGETSAIPNAMLVGLKAIANL